jgi:hypothetical protein
LSNNEGDSKEQVLDDSEEEDSPTPPKVSQLKRSEVISLEVEDETMTEQSMIEEEPEVEDVKQRKLDEFIQVTKPTTPSNTPPKQPSPVYKDTFKQQTLFDFTGQAPEKLLPPPSTSQWITNEMTVKPIDDGKRQTTIEEFKNGIESDLTFRKPKTKRQTLAPSTIFIPTEPTNRRKSDQHLPRKGTPYPSKVKGGFVSASLLDNGQQPEDEEQDEDLENKSESFKLKNYLIMSIIVLIVALMGYAIYFSNVSFSKRGTNFCQSDNDPTLTKVERNCIPCPKFGYCVLGTLTQCESPRILNKELFLCSEDEEITTYATSFIKGFQKDLSIQTGKFICGESLAKGFTFSQVKKQLNHTYNLGEEKIEIVFKKLISILKDAGEFKIVIESSETEDFFYSSDPELSFTCRLTNKVSEYKYIIGSIFAIILLIGFINAVKSHNAHERHKFEEFVAEVKNRLKTHISCGVVNLRDSLVEEFGDQIDVESVWPNVTQEISKDSRVAIKSRTDGTALWEWVEVSGGTSDLNRELFKGL